MFRQTFPLAILAGLCISIGCIVNLRVGGVAGAVLFAFGLTTVVYYKLKLYTGTAGFIRMRGDWSMLGVPVFILCGFTHSIADAFYFLACPMEQLCQPMVLAVYLSEVLGNFVGCNLYRWVKPRES